MLRVKSLSATVSAVYEVLDRGSARFEVKILLLRLGIMEIGGKLFKVLVSGSGFLKNAKLFGRDDA